MASTIRSFFRRSNNRIVPDDGTVSIEMDFILTHFDFFTSKCFLVSIISYIFISRIDINSYYSYIDNPIREEYLDYVDEFNEKIIELKTYDNVLLHYFSKYFATDEFNIFDKEQNEDIFDTIKQNIFKIKEKNSKESKKILFEIIVLFNYINEENLQKDINILEEHYSYLTSTKFLTEIIGYMQNKNVLDYDFLKKRKTDVIDQIQTNIFNITHDDGIRIPLINICNLYFVKIKEDIFEQNTNEDIFIFIKKIIDDFDNIQDLPDIYICFRYIYYLLKNENNFSKNHSATNNNTMNNNDNNNNNQTSLRLGGKKSRKFRSKKKRMTGKCKKRITHKCKKRITHKCKKIKNYKRRGGGTGASVVSNQLTVDIIDIFNIGHIVDPGKNMEYMDLTLDILNQYQDRYKKLKQQNMNEYITIFEEDFKGLVSDIKNYYHHEEYRTNLRSNIHAHVESTDILKKEIRDHLLRLCYSVDDNDTELISIKCDINITKDTTLESYINEINGNYGNQPFNENIIKNIYICLQTAQSIINIIINNTFNSSF